MSETAVKQGHPKGLWVLFGTEMWERFNFYGMRALLTLFMVNSLLIKEADAAIIYGGFLALCYLTPLLGGFIADKYLGNRNCILVGGSLMAIGQFLLFLSASTFSSNLGGAKLFMWIALFIIIFGNGFFKPNISSMVGSLYPKQEKSKLDSAFTIFYMGINIGAFLGQFICPYLGDVKDAETGVRDIFAFKWGFLAASLAMIIGTVTFFILKNKYVVTPEGRPIGGLPKHNTSEDFEEGETQTAKFSGKAIGVAIGIFVALFFVFRFLLVGEFGVNSLEMGQLIKGIIYPFIYSAGIALAYLIMSSAENKVERQRIWVIYIVSFFIIFFWAAFEQAGSSLTFIADNQTDRNIFGWNMPPSMVQIFNGLFVVALALPFSLLWDKLRAKGKEPVSPMKQAMGLALIALSYFIIAHNVKDLGNSGLLAIKWLMLLYLIQTMGELCLSPIGLSLVGKLAPKRFASLLYGVFFIANAAGYALAGSLGAIMPATGDKFVVAQEQNIDLQKVLDKTYQPTTKELFLLAQSNLAEANFGNDLKLKKDFEKLQAENAKIIDSQRKEFDKKQEELKKLKQESKEKFKIDITKLKFPTDENLSKMESGKLIKCEHKTFAGFTIHNLFEFFMVFVVLCGIAAVILAILSPKLKKMMNGVI
ncbi:proton-dependent di-tripeptide transporter [Flavobacterium cauense R2A-7]|uniref:POT family proton-dependent oligopeptide transporter n=1 Tax=Flavobacterium cauense R2A-7 TaxID=1341154 RepID=V6S4V1_9FLAO|nr:peptide MFS transporter [Flavobacterium cauense]ESU21651.1 proton-dependent di-tripeptide transporter [Flavobacterium cauense R2A-7]KGO80103.1 amino acid transporter [Flavobacterium cauense R2A-7]TWI10411.1 POT family proton-dependent oligopeptide transporter [Flavobacterium cauense R2A-7]